MGSRLLFLPLAIALAAVTAAGQATPPPQQQASTKEKKDKKEKRVWTNDDLEGLQAHGGISVVGGTSTSPKAKSESERKPSAGPYSKEKDPKWYREQLAPLRSQLDSIDAQIKQVQNQIDHPSTGNGLVLHQGVSFSFQDQLAQLKQSREKIQKQIDDLEDQARRNGIDPGDIR